MRFVRLVIVGLGVGIARCDDGAAPAARAPVPSCSLPDEAPLPDGDGGVACLRVGADTGSSGRSTHTLEGLPTPVVFVRDGAVGGDGSAARPLGSLDAGLSRVASGGTIALLGAVVPLDRALTLPAGVALVGLGPADTALEVTRGHGALVAAPGAAAVVLRDVTVRYRPGTAAAPEVAVLVQEGATLTARNVRVEGAFEGVVVDGALDAERLSVLRAATTGLAVQGSGAARLRSLLVRDGLGQGVAARPRAMMGPAGRLHITEGAVLDNRGRGVALTGAAAAGRGAASCALAGPAREAGDLDCLARVSVQRNGTHALAVFGARQVEVRGASLSATQVAPGAPDADGLVAAEGARVTVDPEDRSLPRMGRGSIVAGNGRMGVLAVGAGTSLVLRGARVQANTSVGVFVADGASAAAVSYARIDDNGAVGLAVAASATIAEIQCNGIAGTRARSIATTAGESPALGDGINVANVRDLRVDDNELAGNARAGAVFDRVSGGAFTRNRGAGNRFGASITNATMFEDASPMLTGTVANRTMSLGAVPGAPR